MPTNEVRDKQCSLLLNSAGPFDRFNKNIVMKVKIGVRFRLNTWTWDAFSVSEVALASAPWLPATAWFFPRRIPRWIVHFWDSIFQLNFFFFLRQIILKRKITNIQWFLINPSCTQLSSQRLNIRTHEISILCTVMIYTLTVKILHG